MNPFARDNAPSRRPGAPGHWGRLSFCLVFLAGCYPICGHQDNLFKCRDTDLVLYNLVFETHWTRQLFPKQYPDNRPSAHWSKMIGMSHDEEYVLFRIGEMADEPFKTFAETGRTEMLGGQRRQGAGGHVFDEFSTSSIKTGAGRTQVNFFADGNHSKVSLAVKIIPSPDWFVGVDSLALCVKGSWLDSITVEASPMDAGTDSGFTFTAPNWETHPRERISEITSQWPKHPANSFYYPARGDLPVIATFHLAKKKLYQLKRKADAEEKGLPNGFSPPGSAHIREGSSDGAKSRKWRRKPRKHSLKQTRKGEQ